MNGELARSMVSAVREGLERAGDWPPDGYLGAADAGIVNSLVSQVKTLLPDDPVVQAVEPFRGNSNRTREAYVVAKVLETALTDKFPPLR